MRLSTQTTSCPLARKRSHRWEPMKPAPPVMTVRTELLLMYGPRMRKHRRDRPYHAPRTLGKLGKRN